MCVRSFSDLTARQERPVTFTDTVHLSRVLKIKFQKKLYDFDHPGQRYVSRRTLDLNTFCDDF